MSDQKNTEEPRDTKLWLEPKEVNPDLYGDFWEIPCSVDGEIAVEGVYGKANAYRIVEEHNALASIEEVPGFMEKLQNKGIIYITPQIFQNLFKILLTYQFTTVNYRYN